VVEGLTDNYSYDQENRLILLTKQTAGNTGIYQYAYDYRTRRVERVEPTSTTKIVFSGGLSVQEYSVGTDTPLVECVRGSDYGGGVGGILYTLRNGIPSYTHYNSRGDVVTKTDAAGTTTYQAQYEAFGTRTAEQGTTQDRQKANTKDDLGKKATIILQQSEHPISMHM
jgi:YD repeat-containing protein